MDWYSHGKHEVNQMGAEHMLCICNVGMSDMGIFSPQVGDRRPSAKLHIPGECKWAASPSDCSYLSAVSECISQSCHFAFHKPPLLLCEYDDLNLLSFFSVLVSHFFERPLIKLPDIFCDSARTPLFQMNPV